MRIAVVGGLGHIGLPLALLLQEHGHNVEIYDINRQAMMAFQSGSAMFHEPGLNQLIRKYNRRIHLHYGNDDEIHADAIIVATNMDNPLGLLVEYLERADPTPIFIRQTIRPGMIKQFETKFENVAYVPERIAQGNQLSEFQTIPQIVGSRTQRMALLAEKIFSWLEVIHVTPEEAEIAKLGCNFYRYATFAASNALYMTCVNQGIDFNNVRAAMIQDYPRMSHFPKAGWSGGFCLPKDTKLLSPFTPFANDLLTVNNASFPQFLFAQLRYYLDKGYSVSVLGLTAMANVDDLRGSLLSILREEFEATPQITLYDPFLYDPPMQGTAHISPLHVALEADVICIGIPHEEFKNIDFTGKILIDPWGVAQQKIVQQKAS